MVLSLAQIQSEVLAAVCDVRTPVPDYIESGFDDDRRLTRFNIYRNNFYVAVINVLKERFPVTERIVGEEFFKATAREFVEQTPPHGQSNLGYGTTFPAFLENFPPVADVPYLAHVARLEWARFKAAVAPDQRQVTSQDFAAVDASQAARVSFTLHPSMRTLSSDYPIYDIWRTNHEDEQVQTLSNASDAQSVLVIRNANGIEVHKIPNGAIEFIKELGSGRTLGDAFERVSDTLTHQEFSTTLSLLLSSGAVTELRLPEFTKFSNA